MGEREITCNVPGKEKGNSVERADTVESSTDPL